jgi:hypothetical protein
VLRERPYRRVRRHSTRARGRRQRETSPGRRGNLSRRVNAGIRPPGHEYRAPGPSQLVRAFSSSPCTVPACRRGLPLASEKIRAVVGKSQLVTCHCSSDRAFAQNDTYYSILQPVPKSPFQPNHPCGVRASIHGCSRRAVGKAGRDLVEEALDHLVVSQLGDHQAAGMHLLGITAVRAVAGEA